MAVDAGVEEMTVEEYAVAVAVVVGSFVFAVVVVAAAAALGFFHSFESRAVAAAVGASFGTASLRTLSPSCLYFAYEDQHYHL